MSYMEASPHVYHRQDTSNDCGPAAAQDVIYSTCEEKLGSGKGVLIDQAALGKYILSKTSIDRLLGIWSSSPEAMVYALTSPPGLGKAPCTDFADREFKSVEQSSEVAISRWIVWSIYKYKRAAIALVHGFKHWVVVYGCEVSKKPLAPTDPTPEIHAFYVHDPAPAEPPYVPFKVIPSSSHKAGDVCGDGGIEGRIYQRIEYKEWQSSWMTGVPHEVKPGKTSHWSDYFVAILDLPISDAHLVNPRPAPAGTITPPPPATKPLPTRITEADAKAGATDWLGKTFPSPGSSIAPDWYSLIDRDASGKPSLTAADALRVDGATPDDPLDYYYYLVEMQNSAAHKPIVVMVSAFDKSDVLGAAAAKSTDEDALGKVDPGLIGDAVHGKKLLAPLRPGGRTDIGLSDFENYDIVWSPIPYSLTPYAPFYRFVFDGVPIYVRIDDIGFVQLASLVPLGGTLDLTPYLLDFGN